MKLKKHERHAAYIIMLAEAEERDPAVCQYGFCRMMREVFPFCDKDKFMYCEQIKILTELNNKRPNDNDITGWFEYGISGWQKRIELLKQCIEETYEW